MKKFLVVSVVLIGMVFSINSYAKNDTADTSANTGSIKIAYVDFAKALNDTKEGQKAQATLKSEFDKRQLKLDVLKNELKSLQEDLEKKKLILSAEALQEKEKNYQAKFLELQQKHMDFRQEMAQKEMELTSGILAKLKTIVSEIGEKESYNLILEKSQEVVLYAPSVDDLTDKVVTLCDKRK